MLSLRTGKCEWEGMMKGDWLMVHGKLKIEFRIRATTLMFECSYNLIGT